MASNFFQRQEAARRATLLLVIYFALAVVLIVFAVNVLFFGVGHFFGAHFLSGTWYWHEWSRQIVPCTLLLILGGSTITFFQLAEGGRAVARMVNATPVAYDAREPGLRQLLNVVEEMAIASGVRMPEVYWMERERGINAFVAGYAPDQAVIVVTAGALEHLTREELQGVVGHEFSHILNGDMRLNIRLIALLSGILTIGQLGEFLMRSGSNSNSYNTRSRSTGTFFALGLGLWLVGAIGLVCGRLIKAAISRQRETLADASSVQFTRNPYGLAGALAKIGEQSGGSFLDARHAESMSHMCFGPSLQFGDWFATHPPLEERIRAIAPDFMARSRARQRRGGAVPVVPPPTYRAGPWDSEQSPIMGLAGSDVSARVGTVRPADLHAAARLRARLPEALLKALETSAGARALLYGVIAVQHKGVPYTVQQQFIAEKEGSALAAAVADIRVALGAVSGASLPLVELALPRLSLLDDRASRELIAHLQAFSRLDHQTSVFEFTLLTLLVQQLLPRKPARGHLSLRALRGPLCVVITVLLRHAGLPEAAQHTLYDKTLTTLLGTVPPMPAASAATLPQMALALRALAALTPEGKRQLLNACVQLVQQNGRVAESEYELLRVIAALLACPLPLSVNPEP